MAHRLVAEFKAGSLLNVAVGREFGAERINRIINNPSTFAASFGLIATPPVDLSGLISGNDPPIVFAGKHGFILFDRIGTTDAYDVHAAVLPAGRGEWCRRAAHQTFNYLFLEIGAALAVFRIPQGNLAASAGARMLGAVFSHKTPPAFPASRGIVPLRVYHLTRERWRQKCRWAF